MSSEQNFTKEDVTEWLKNLQDEVVQSLERFETYARFKEHRWQRPEVDGGGGITRVLSGGKVFEKAGVNTSAVQGKLNPALAEKLNAKVLEFFATGISLVLHPVSPQVPTVHANFRYFEQPDRRWFGGGSDLTPYTVSEENFAHFHQVWKNACSFSYGPELYREFKQLCDDYFYLPHRAEHRGIGGIFFDYRTEGLDQFWKFVQRAGNSFLEAYIPIVEKTHELRFTTRQKEFQLLRRGRYVEFNLVYDRGTLFGLQTKGNTESILMSLPPEVKFAYSPNLEQTDEEKLLMSWIRKPRTWA